MEIRKVVVNGYDGKQYLGDVAEDQLEKLEAGAPVKMRNVWQLVTLDNHVVDQKSGQLAGLSRGYMLMNLVTAKGAVPELNVLACGWYDLVTCGVAESFKKLIDQAQAMAHQVQEKPQILRAGPGALQALQGRNGLPAKRGDSN